jgi:hypothetical protein
MTPATSFSERARTRLLTGLLAILLAGGACKEAPRPGTPETPPTKLEPSSVPSAEPAPKPRPPVPGQLLKTQAAHLTAIELVSCPEGRRIATLPPPLLRQLQQALSQATLSEDAALTPPPWDARLVFHLDSGQAIYGQLVRSDVLRLYETAQCTGTRAATDELRLGEEAQPLFGWVQERLGPTEEKAYQTPPGLPPPPGD